MSLLERQLFALAQAKCSSITLIVSDFPMLSPTISSRIHSLKIPIQITNHLPQKSQPCLLVDGETFLEASDVKRFMKDSTLCKMDLLTMNISKISKISNISKISSRATNLLSQKAATALARQLIQESSSASDGLVDRFFNRPASRLLTKQLLELGISPNLISVTAILFGLTSAALFSIPAREFSIGAALLFQISAILDCADGDVARLHFKESRFGKWLDLIGDQLVHIALFAGIGTGLIKTMPSLLSLKILTWSAVFGSIFALITFMSSNSPNSNPLQDRFVKAIANRDFSILILIFSCLGRLDIFMWLAGIGIHGFWIGLLILRFRFFQKTKTQKQQLNLNKPKS